jgi:hypothetical protein
MLTRLLDRTPFGLVPYLGLFQRSVEQRRQLPRNAQDTGAASHVGQDGDVEHRIAHIIGQRHADRRIIVEHDDAFVLSRDAQFLLRADHGVGFHAADLGAFERDQHLTFLVPVIDLRAFFGVGHFDGFWQLAFAFVLEQVRRAGQHNMLNLAIVQVAQHQPVRVGMRHHLADFRHDQFFFIPGNAAGLELVTAGAYLGICQPT